MNTLVALLRGINVGGRNRLPMAELRAACDGAGWAGVRTYIQSGNIVLRAREPEAAVEEALEALIEKRFGLEVPVIVRSSRAWSASLRGNPFPEAAGAEPNRVMIGVAKAAPAEDAADLLRGRALEGERVVRAGDDLWFHFPAGVGRSKLAPGLIDRAAGAPVTLRNWRSALAIEALARSS